LAKGTATTLPNQTGSAAVDLLTRFFQILDLRGPIAAFYGKYKFNLIFAHLSAPSLFTVHVEVSPAPPSFLQHYIMSICLVAFLIDPALASPTAPV
jgi:hypothetical protein